MKLHKWLEESTPEVIRQLTAVQHELEDGADGRDAVLAEQCNITQLLDDLIAIVLPGFRGYCTSSEPRHELDVLIGTVAPRLQEQIQTVLVHHHATGSGDPQEDFEDDAIAAVIHVLDSLVEVKQALQADLRAAFAGDPAAGSVVDVIMSYPCVLAIATYRVAHLLYQKDVPLIPRMMTELAHSRTGIDINPGAEIGHGFFIDHGTGVVIGETCVIGRNVKLYQSVTLGALSFPKDAEGNVVRGKKRHPNVEDNVTIYAGATILGGDTTIGEGSEIGGNVWLTHSVAPRSRVYNQQPCPLIKPTEG
jgi:serine O-acetyltransferase